METRRSELFRSDESTAISEALHLNIHGDEDAALRLYTYLECELWDCARSCWRGWKGASVSDPYGTQVIVNAAAAEVFWRAALALEPSLGDRFERTDTVTLAKNNRAIERHRDNVAYAGTHKLLLYANGVGDCDVGGTRFHLRDGTALDVEYVAGRLVLFDLSLEHEGLRNVSGHVKRTLGLRITARA